MIYTVYIFGYAKHIKPFIGYIYKGGDFIVKKNENNGW